MKQILILFSFYLVLSVVLDWKRKHYITLLKSISSNPEYYYDMLNNDTINEMYSFIRFTTKEGKKVQRIVNEFQDIDDG